MRSHNNRHLAGLVLAFFLTSPLFLAVDLHAGSRLRRGGVDVLDHTGGRFSLELAAGVAGLGGLSHGRFALTVTPRLRLRSSGRTSLDLTIPLLWVPASYPDPRQLSCPEDRGPFAQCGFGDLPVEAVEPEVGPSIALAPSLEWTFHTGCCFEPSFFAGAGVWHDRSRSTPIAGDLRLATEDETSPLLTLGAAITRPLTARTSLRIEGRVIRTFYDATTVTGPFGIPVEQDEERVITGVVTVGVRFHF